MDVKVTGLERFKHTVKAAEARLIGQLNQEYRKLTRKVLIDLAAHTPQWSGDLAASWRVVISSNSGATRETSSGSTGFKVTPCARPAPFSIGSRPAVDYALLNNEDVISTLKYNMKVTLVNTNPTKDLIDEKSLRPGNYIPGDMMAVAYVSAKYSRSDMRLSGSTV